MEVRTTRKTPAVMRQHDHRTERTVSNPSKPSPFDLQAAAGATIPDLIAPGLRVLFCGINPGLYSGYTGFHFARPGNRFWRGLAEAGFTPRVLTPDEQYCLLQLGCGVTNLVTRATARGGEVTRAELEEGARRLQKTVELYRPWSVAILGIGAYRMAFGQPQATMGRQMQGIGPAPLWVLPNPSGANGHFPPAALAASLRSFRRDLEALHIWPSTSV